MTFVFGMDVRIPLQIRANERPDKAWKKLRRPTRYTLHTNPRYKLHTNRRRKGAKVKERIVQKRKFENLKLVSEDVAELEYRPAACHCSRS